jgi:hypothetical protein
VDGSFVLFVSFVPIVIEYGVPAAKYLDSAPLPERT